MQLYRVSDSDDDGPYKKDVPGLLSEHDGDYDNHPTPTEDRTIRHLRKSEVCACTSLAALYEWFAGWADDLSSAGYVVRIVDVPEDKVRVGTHGQAVYLKSAAREIRAFPVSRHAHTYV